MSELPQKRVRTSLKAIAQFKRACIFSNSLSERCYHVKFLVGSILYSKKILPNDISTLHKPVMQPELPLDGSVLQQAMLPLYISVLKQPVLPGRVFSIEPMLPLNVSKPSKAACAVSERVYPTAA